MNAARTARLFVLSLAVSEIPAAAPSGRLATAGIALRCAGSTVLIVGQQVDANAVDKLFRAAQGGLREIRIEPAIGPGEWYFEISPGTYAQLAAKRAVGFVPGAKWHVYTGSGRPVSVAVEKLVLSTHGNGNQYLTALGRILNPGDANRIAGLDAGAYLALPGAVVPAISETPLVSEAPDREAVRLLFTHAQQIVSDESRQVNPASADSSRAREINRAFLGRTEPTTTEIRGWRFRSGKKGALQFIEAVWIDESHNLPLFAVDAILQGQTILSFDPWKAEGMRGGAELRDHDWHLDKDFPPFLNAWRIGAETWVLAARWGYEGFSVDLQQLDFKKGPLMPIFSYGD